MLNKLALLSFAIVSLTGFAYAGPEAVQASGKDLKEVVQQAPECWTWTGFYVGGFGGFTHSGTDTHLDLGGQWLADPSDLTDARAIEAESPKDLDASGGQVGGILGYNYQWRNWVFGLEGSGAYLWLRNSDQTGDFTTGTGDVYHLGTSLKTHYLATAGPRIGYSLCRWLPYITGGVAIGDIDYNQEIIQTLGAGRQGVRFDGTNAGWMVGAGLEYALTRHWRARVQYQFIDLGRSDMFNRAPAPNQAYTAAQGATLREHNASAALVYGF